MSRWTSGRTESRTRSARNWVRAAEAFAAPQACYTRLVVRNGGNSSSFRTANRPISFPPPAAQPTELDLHMERAARLIKKNKYSRQMITDEDIVRGLWPAAVGPAIARHTCKLKIVRNTLVVEVEDATWQKQLSRLSHQVAA